MAMLSGIILGIGYVVICVTGNIIDLTCYASRATIDRDGNDEVIIGGYKSGADTDIDVEFGRESFTGTGNGLPSGSVQEDHSSGKDVAELLRLPGSAGTARIGAFYCQTTKYGITERIVTTIMASGRRYVTPNENTITANLGESVTLSVTLQNHVSNEYIKWRHNEGSEMWAGQTSPTICGVTTSNAGIYECYTKSPRNNFRTGNHAIMQLIVRACPAERWDPPTCNNICPHCYNGGVCDDRSGICVCAPGFSGSECQFVHGSNRWGQDGQRMCSANDDDGNDPHSTACFEKLFCLPHPFGCTCAAGYYGIDCNQTCTQGTYGANCRSECHCAEGASCLPDTGECSDGLCRLGWNGVNCQDIRAPKKIQDLDDAQVTSTTVTMILPETDNKYVTTVTVYQVGVEMKETQRKRRQARRFGHYFESKEAYIAAELLVNDVIRDPTFVVGDGEFYGEYYNAPLQENKTYTLYVAFIRRTNSTVSVYNPYKSYDSKFLR